MRQLRKRHHLSGERFGELCGVTKGMVSQWESDLVIPTTDKLMELRRHIEFSFDWILYGEAEKLYSTRDHKLGRILQVLEPQPDYVKEAAASAVLTSCELADKARGNGTDG